MRYLYTLTIYCYCFGIFAASFFHKKAKLWVNGRRNLFTQIAKTIDEKYEIVWFHAASLGEFEQGRTIIEAFRKNYPDYKILLTFFSPSGYEIRKNYPNADYIFYLPLDTPKNAHTFIKLAKPKYVFFIKYEFWFNILKELKRKGIPTYIISAIFRTNQHFFKSYGTWFRQQLAAFSYFFVQNQMSSNLLQSIGFNNVCLSGDTRFDRVQNIANNPREFPIVEKFKQNKPVLMVGSSWPEDEKIIKACFLNKTIDYKIIFAPHEISDTHISSLKSMFPEDSICYSEADEQNIFKFDILIIDSIGMLSDLYKYASVAYIGGGFGKGIHNVLEAVVFGIPVFFGPKYKNFQEAVDLVKIQGGFCIQNEVILSCQIKLLLEDKDLYQKTSEICKNYVAQNTGATAMIMNVLKNYIGN